MHWCIPFVMKALRQIPVAAGALLFVLELVRCEPYVIDSLNVAYLPAFQSPYRYTEIVKKKDANFNSNNVHTREIEYGCQSYGYDLPGSHSGFYGCRRHQDKLLFTETIFKPKRFLTTREQFLDYPGPLPRGHVRHDVITAIWCYDSRGYGKGGHCNIMDGGIGMRHVRMHLYHQERNVPLRFRVEIYGHINQTAEAEAALHNAHH